MNPPPTGPSFFSALRAERTALSVLAVLALLVSLLLPVAAVSLEAHAGVSLDLSTCRTQMDGDDAGPGGMGQMCVCVCVKGCSAGFGRPGGDFAILWPGKPDFLALQNVGPDPVRWIALLAAARGPPSFI